MARGCSGGGQGIGLSFLIFMSLASAFLAACVACYIYAMVLAGDSNNNSSSYYWGSGRGRVYVYRDNNNGAWIALWTICTMLMIAVIILGWLWFCCCLGDFCMGVTFTVFAGIAFIMFIVLLGVFDPISMCVAIGVIGMLLCLGLLVLGILGLVLGGMNS